MERKYQIAGTSLVLTPEGEVLAAAYGPGAAQKFCDALNHERERALSAEARAERLAKVSAGYACDGAGCIRNAAGEIIGHTKCESDGAEIAAELNAVATERDELKAKLAESERERNENACALAKAAKRLNAAHVEHQRMCDELLDARMDSGEDCDDDEADEEAGVAALEAENRALRAELEKGGCGMSRYSSYAFTLTDNQTGKSVGPKEAAERLNAAEAREAKLREALRSARKAANDLAHPTGERKGNS